MLFKFYLKNLIFCFVIFFMVLSCKPENELEKRIAKLNTSIDIERFDMLFANVSPNDFPNLKKEYPFMFPEQYSDSFWLAKKNDTLQKLLFQEVSKVFSDFSAPKADIESLFNHLIYYFPEFVPPRVITVTNEVDYRNNVIVTDSLVLLALDNYLGSDHEFYVYGNIPKYVYQDFKKEQVVIDLAQAYAKKFVPRQHNKTLLDEMVYFGKLLYFKDRVIPFKTEAERINYQPEQLRWAIDNESYIWRYFVERELLFSTDSKLPSRFINPAPFTKFYLEEIDAESPGRLGQYIGWQIVRAYMENNNVNLTDMFVKSTEEIFNNSKFKPRK